LSDFPHVTEILRLVRNMDFTPESALERGRHVHKACALLDGWGDGSGLDFENLHPVLVPYVDAYHSFREIRRPVYIAIEHKVEHQQYRYQGRLDRATEEDVYDLKCGSDVHPAEGLQLAAYERAYGRKHRRRFSIHLYPNGRFKVHEWKDRSNFSVFLALLNIHNWRIRHGIS